MTQLTVSSAAPRPQLYRVPLVPVALAFAAGIVAGRSGQLHAGFWAALGAAGLLAAAATFPRRHLHLFMACSAAVAILAIGAVHARLAWFSVPEDHVVTYTNERPILATLRGRIVTAPIVHSGHQEVPKGDASTLGAQPALGYRPPPKTSLLIDAKAIGLSPPRPCVR